MVKGCTFDTDGDGNCPIHPGGCPSEVAPQPTQTELITAALDEARWLGGEYRGSKEIHVGLLGSCLLAMANVIGCKTCHGTGRESIIVAGVQMDSKPCSVCSAMRSKVVAWLEARR